MNPPIPPIPPPVSPAAYPATPPPPASGGAKKWVLLGCGGCLGLLVIGGVAIAAFVFFVMGALKKSDAFTGAVKRAESSPEVQAALGTPIETGWMIQGSANYHNGNGEADLTIPLKGPKGEATLKAVGKQAAGGPWIYSQLEVALPGGTPVDLLHGAGPAAETGQDPEPVK